MYFHVYLIISSVCSYVHISNYVLSKSFKILNCSVLRNLRITYFILKLIEISLRVKSVIAAYYVYS